VNNSRLLATSDATEESEVVDIVFRRGRLEFPWQRQSDRDWLVKLAASRLDRYDWSDTDAGTEDFSHQFTWQRLSLDNSHHSSISSIIILD